MSKEIEAAIVKRAKELGLNTDVPSFARELAFLVTTFYTDVRAVGSKYKVVLTVDSNVKIEKVRNKFARTQ